MKFVITLLIFNASLKCLAPSAPISLFPRLSCVSVYKKEPRSIKLHRKRIAVNERYTDTLRDFTVYRFLYNVYDPSRCTVYAPIFMIFLWISQIVLRNILKNTSQPYLYSYLPRELKLIKPEIK